MKIWTPGEVADPAGNKYVGVLVAARFARFINEFPRDRSLEWEEKLTTRALEQLVHGELSYKLIRQRRPET
jgi:DNA-directed RNA polymerase subunit K/omega